MKVLLYHYSSVNISNCDRFYSFGGHVYLYLIYCSSDKHKVDSEEVALKDFVQSCFNMTIGETHIAKLTPKRIFSLDIHPANHGSPLLAVGDKYGHVGLWNMVSMCGLKYQSKLILGTSIM